MAGCACNSFGERNLHKAAKGQKVELVKEILEVRPDLASRRPLFSRSCNILHSAAASGSTEVLRAILIALRKDPKDKSLASQKNRDKLLKAALNGRTGQGQTPLMLACAWGHASCARLLLISGCDSLAVDQDKQRSAIHHAAANKHIGVLKLLLDDALIIHTGDGVLPLKHVPVDPGNERCRYIDSKSKHGLSALHLAAAAESVECVEVLLAAGASPAVKTTSIGLLANRTIVQGSTPLHIAAELGSLPIIQSMLQAMVESQGSWQHSGSGTGLRRPWEGDRNVDIRSMTNAHRQMPFHLAAANRHAEAMRAVNPTFAIDSTIQTILDTDAGIGPQSLVSLAGVALKVRTLQWLKDFQKRPHNAKLGRQASAHPVKQAPKQQPPRPTSQDCAAPGQVAAVRMASALSPLPGNPIPLAGEPCSNARRVAEPSVHSTPHWADQALLYLLQPSLQADEVAEPSQGHGSRVELGLAKSMLTSSSNIRSLKHITAVSASSALAATAAGIADPKPQSVAEPDGRQRLSACFRQPSLQGGTHVQSGDPVRANSAMAETSCKKPGWRRSADGFMRRRSSRTLDLSQVCTLSDPQRTGAPAGIAQAPHGSPLCGSQERHDAFSSGKKPAILLTSPFSSAAQAPFEDRDATAALPIAPDGGEPVTRLQSDRLSAGPSMRHALSMLRTASKALRGSFSKTRRTMSTAASRAARDAGIECGICLDNLCEVEVQGCNHRLCVQCAIQVCNMKKGPPFCPFCRALVTGFQEPMVA